MGWLASRANRASKGRRAIRVSAGLKAMSDLRGRSGQKVRKVFLAMRDEMARSVRVGRRGNLGPMAKMAHRDRLARCQIISGAVRS